MLGAVFIGFRLQQSLTTFILDTFILDTFTPDTHGAAWYGFRVSGDSTFSLHTVYM